MDTDACGGVLAPKAYCTLCWKSSKLNATCFMPEGLQHEAVSLRSGEAGVGAKPVQGSRTNSIERYTAVVFGEKLQCRRTAKLRRKPADPALREELPGGAASFRTTMT